MVLGIDVSKDFLDCYQLIAGNAAHKRVENSERGIKALLDWLERDVHVVMEATGVYWQSCAFALHQQGVKVSVVNPAGVKHFARATLRRGKTDSMDAELLALYAQQMQPALWSPPRAVYAELQLLVRERDDVVDQVRQMQNQQHAHQHRYTCSDTLLKLLDERISLLKTQLKTLEQSILRLCKQQLSEPYQSLRSVPGIGAVTASVLLAETAGLENFEHPKQLTAYAGIAPAPNQSGSFVGRSSISKVGNPRIRQACYMAALQARRYGVFKSFYERLLRKGKAPKVALVAVARKLLVIAFTLVKSNQRFDPNRLCKT